MINKFHLSQTVISKRNYTLVFLLSFVSILVYTSLQCPSPAFADDDCILSKESKAAYIADGTYNQRVAFQQSLNNSSPQEGLIAQAKAQEELTLSDIAQQSNVPQNWESGMGTTGKAHVLVLRVSFPDYKFDDDDTPEALESLFCGEDTSSFPYESLHDYYYRASYGKLDIQATVFSYKAIHERGYYTDKQLTLFDEAISALRNSNQLNLEDYDKNNDGKIDSVYLHFAGDNTGWGSAWWSHEQSAGGAYEYDGKKLWNIVTLHNKSNNTAAAKTVIHETGHVLGLPDYYSYNQSLSSENSGILTSDMMMDNRGDHNAFSKWLLGWVNSDNIIRIVANSSGTKVKKGLGNIETYPAGTTLSETLSSFTAQDVSSSGGFIAVSNNESLLQDKGLFSSFYLLQYDIYTQNQSVMYSYNNGTYLHNLSSGFRVYRIQADLNPTGSDFIKSNSNGTVHDQLIELVDPDRFTEDGTPVAHYLTNESILSSDKSSAEGWACMYHQGAMLTPTTNPSTNFYENASSGFTGLTFSFTKNEATEGTVEVSFSEKDQPIVPDFSITADEGTEIYPQSTLNFTTSTPVTIEQSLGNFAFLYIDGKESVVGLSLDSETHTKITFSTELDSVDLNAESQCSIVFPEGLFLYAKTPSQKYVSPRIELDLPVGSLAKIASNNGVSYGSTTQYINKMSVSSFFTNAQGMPGFIQRTDEKLLLHILEQDNYSSIKETHELGLDLASSWDFATLKALPLENGLLCVVTNETNANNVANAQHYLWFDPSNNYQLIAQKTISNATNPNDPSALLLYDVNKIFPLGSTVVTGYFPGGKPGIILGGFDVDFNEASDASITEHWAKLDANSFSPIGNKKEDETIAISHYADNGLNVNLIRSSSLHAALAQGVNTFTAALDTSSCDPLLEVLSTLPISDYYACNDVAFYKGRYFILASSPTYLKPKLPKSILLRFDSDNSQEPEKTCALTTKANNNATYKSLTINNEGIISASYTIAKQMGTAFRTTTWNNEAIFYDCNLSPAVNKSGNTILTSTDKAPRFINFSNAYGIWKNNAFCLPGWLINSTGPTSSYSEVNNELSTQDVQTTAHYLATNAFVSVQPDWITDPDPKPDPDVPFPNPDSPNPDSSNTSNQHNSAYIKGNSAKTADNTALLTAFLAGTAFSSALVLLRASAQIATKKK